MTDRHTDRLTDRQSVNQPNSKSSKALIRLGLHLAHVLLMQVHHATLPHTAIHDVLSARLIDPLLLPAATLTALLIHQLGATGIELFVAVVGRCIRCLEASVPGRNRGITVRECR